MKKKTVIKILIIILVLCIIIYLFKAGNFTNKIKQYDYSPDKAIEYSYKYIEERNPEFPNFEYNCITYISQCLLAGGIEMDEVKTLPIPKTEIKYTSKEWFSYSYDMDPYQPIAYHVSSSFSHCHYFIKYWKNIGKVPVNTVENNEEGRKILENNIKIGDVIILHGSEDVEHAAIIVRKNNGKLYYNSNTNNRLEYPLHKVNEESYPKITYLNFVK